MHIYEVLENMSKDNKNTTKQLISIKILEMFLDGKFKNQKDFAKSCFVSESTLTRFSKDAGCSGYRELLIKLKIEHERLLLRTKQEIENNIDKQSLQVFNFINNWIIDQQDFLNNFVKDVILFKKVRIFASYQSINASNYLLNILQIKNYCCELINATIDFIRDNNFLNDNTFLNLVILTGRDVDSLVNYFISKLFKTQNKKNYIITTISQKNKINLLNFKKSCILNYEGDNSQFILRHLALTNLFAYMSIKLDVSK